jgi:uncharacterized protein
MAPDLLLHPISDVAEALTGVSNREVVYPPPEHQDQKIAAIRTAAPHLEAALNPPQRPSAPSDKDVVEAIRTTAADLSMAAGSATGPGADAARHVSDLLTRLARSDAATRSKVEAAVIPSLVYGLDRLRDSLDPQPVTVKTLPSNVVRDWLLPDGRARVQILPKAGDDNSLRKFATSVLAADPSATGAAISLYESGKTVIGAFVEAGALALAAIAVLLFIALRRLTDELLTLRPLLVAGAVTLEICVLTGVEIENTGKFFFFSRRRAQRVRMALERWSKTFQ